MIIRTTKQSHHNKVFEAGIKRGRERCLVDLQKTIKEIKDWREKCINCDCSQSEDYHKGLIDGYTLVIMELNELCKSPEQKKCNCSDSWFYPDKNDENKCGRCGGAL